MMKRFLLILLLALALAVPSLADEYIFHGEPLLILEEVPLPDVFARLAANKAPEVHFAPLDALGRAGAAYAVVTQVSVSGQTRESIAGIEPVGFHQTRYPFLKDELLYDRCHLIGSQLATGTEVPENLITGTVFMNIQGMLVAETKAANYVQYTGKSIFYSVTPDYRGDELLCRGVLIQAADLENPEYFSFAVYCFNVQPGVIIDYANGYSDLAPTAGTVLEPYEYQPAQSEERSYVLNMNSHVFHLPDCSGAKTMKEKNRRDYTGTRDELIELGYRPCGSCHP